MKARALALTLLCAGCTKGAEAVPEDRLIARLKEEKARSEKELAQGGTVATGPDLLDPNVNVGEDPLAKTAAEPPAAVTPLKLPEKIDFTAGKLSVRLNGVETSQSIAGAKVKLSTNEQFLRVDLKLRAAEALEFDLGAATVKAGDESFPIARDVQHVVGTRNLARPLAAGESLETVLMFELP